MDEDRFKIYSLLLVNIFIIIMAFVEKWRFFDVAIIYWLQIGIMLFFEFIRVLLGDISKQKFIIFHKLFSIFKILLLYCVGSILLYDLIFSHKYFTEFVTLSNIPGVRFALIVIFIQSIVLLIYERMNKVRYVVNSCEGRAYSSTISLTVAIYIFGLIFMAYQGEIINTIGIIVFVFLKALNDLFVKNIFSSIIPEKEKN